MILVVSFNLSRLRRQLENKLQSVYSPQCFGVVSESKIHCPRRSTIFKEIGECYRRRSMDLFDELGIRKALINSFAYIIQIIKRKSLIFVQFST